MKPVYFLPQLDAPNQLKNGHVVAITSFLNLKVFEREKARFVLGRLYAVNGFSKVGLGAEESVTSYRMDSTAGLERFAVVGDSDSGSNLALCSVVTWQCQLFPAPKSEKYDPPFPSILQIESFFDSSPV